MKGVESSKPKKQRLFHYSKPLHRKQHGLAGHLGKELRKQLGKRSVSIRKGDTVKVMRGGKMGSSGKVTGVDYTDGTVFIDKLVRKKADGTEIPLPVKASNLLVTGLEKGDARRFKGKKLEEEKKGGEKKEEKAAGKEKKEEKEMEEGKKAKEEKRGGGKKE